MKIIDLSKDSLETPVYPGDPEPRVQKVRQIALGDSCNLSALYTCVHTGTHVDAPLHFLEQGESIGELPLDAYIGRCHVVETAGPVTGQWVDEQLPWGCERVLFKSGGQAWVMEAAAQDLAQLGIRLVGVDSASVGGPENPYGPHTALLGGGVAVLENLDLSQVEPGEYFLFAPPVKWGKLEGAPARAILIDGYIFWNKSH